MNEAGEYKMEMSRVVWLAIGWVFLGEPLFVLSTVWWYRNVGTGMYDGWGNSILTEQYWRKVVMRSQNEIGAVDGASQEEIQVNLIRAGREITWTFFIWGVNYIVFGAFVVWTFTIVDDYGWTTGKSFFWDGWVSGTGIATAADSAWYYVGLLLIVWAKAGFVTFLHSFPDDMQYWLIHVVQHTPKMVEFVILKFFWNYIDHDERKRLGKKWLPTKFPILFKIALVSWNWQHAVHHAITYVTVEVKIGAGNLVDKVMEVRMLWVFIMVNYALDFLTGGNWGFSQLDWWAFVITHIWRDSFIHYGRAMPYAHQLPQAPWLSDLGIIPGWDKANESHTMHHWGPSHFSNFSNQGFWDFMFGTDTRYGYDAGVWPGVPLNDVRNPEIIGFAMRMHNYGFDNAKRDHMWRMKGAEYENLNAMETGEGDWPVAKEDRGVIMDSYKLPLLEKSGIDGKWTDELKVYPQIRNKRWDRWGWPHRLFAYTLACLGPGLWAVAIYQSQVCPDGACHAQ